MIKKILILIFMFIVISTNAASFESVGRILDDTSITAVVKAKIAKNPIISIFDIDVSTTNKVVYLSGHVDTDLQFEKAAILAMSTNGVRDVNVQHLLIKTSKHPISDTIITAKIQALLFKQALSQSMPTAFSNLKVRTYNRTVYIVGKVNNEALKQKALQVIHSVPEAQEVKADIKVQSA